MNGQVDGWLARWMSIPARIASLFNEQKLLEFKMQVKTGFISIFPNAALWVILVNGWKIQTCELHTYKLISSRVLQ